jgi:hypothetical protein
LAVTMYVYGSVGVFVCVNLPADAHMHMWQCSSYSALINWFSIVWPLEISWMSGVDEDKNLNMNYIAQTEFLKMPGSAYS